MIKETMTYEEFKQMSQDLNASDVEIAVAAAFAGEGFEAVDCRHLGQDWKELQNIIDRHDRGVYYGRGDADFLIEIAETLYNLDFFAEDAVPQEVDIYDLTHTGQYKQAQEWAALILQRIYEVSDE